MGALRPIHHANSPIPRVSGPTGFNASAHMSRRVAIRLTIALFWIVAMLALLRYEAFPELFTHTLRGYRGVLEESILMQESWSRILVNGVPAGYSHTSMGVADEDTEANIEVHNRTQLKLAFMKQPLAVYVHTTLILDPQYDLLQFDSALSARGTSFRVTGQRTVDRQYEIATFMGETTTRRIIEIPKDVVLYSPMNALALRQLRPGQDFTIKTLDPLSMTTTRIVVRAIRQETLQRDEGPVTATLLTSRYQGLELNSWIDKNGTVLRQETPLGWVIESCNSEAALDAVTDNEPPPELMTLGTGTMLMKLLTRGQNGQND